MVKNNDKPFTLSLPTAESTTTEICASSELRINAGDKPRLGIKERSDKICCSRVTHHRSMSEYEVATQLKGSIGIRLIDEIQKSVLGKKDTDLSLSIQKFNGMGCTGPIGPFTVHV